MTTKDVLELTREEITDIRAIYDSRPYSTYNLCRAIEAAVIAKAIEAITAIKQAQDDHFRDVAKMMRPLGWYCLSREGLATQCASQDDAEVVAESAQRDWPNGGPYKAVQLYEYTKQAQDVALINEGDMPQAITSETGNAATPEESAITAGNGQAQEPVGINGLTEAETSASMSVMGLSRPQAPYPNCRFRICDLPGQCKGEGKCHHPAVQQADPAWQPIESAPKDGREILLAHADGSLTVGYWSSARNSMYREYAWCDASTDFSVTWPTHWQPAPTPPEAK